MGRRGQRGWRQVLMMVAAGVMWAATVVVPAEAVAPTFLGALRKGQPIFTSTTIDTAVANLECTEDNCREFTFDVRPGAKELRVAAQTARRGDFWSISLYGPHDDENPAVPADGNAPFTMSPGGVVRADLQRFGIEQRVERPAAGLWRLQVILQDTEVGATDTGGPIEFAIRAALDPNPEGVFGAPNLRVRPPYEFGLAVPANPTSGAAVDRQNPALSVAGAEPASCSWDEMALAAEHGDDVPTRCLRFSAAVYEGGAGRVELWLEGYDGGFTPDGTVYQRMHTRDGIIEREAGRWEFHMTHGHPHYVGFLDYEVDRVTFDALGTPRLQSAAGTGKTGYNTVDQRIADWTSFAQDRQFAALEECKSPCIALGAGYEDHYRWQRTGQYVPLEPGAAGDGLYVVRIRVNSDGRLLETKSDDNTSYALVLVEGDAVKVCERGLGDHPWARGAEPVADEWRPLREGAPEAATACPAVR